jgi:hypothetical protein
VRQDPIISGGWVKAALVILIAGALGVGTYVLVSGVDIDLPDLPDVDTDSAETSLSNTTLQDTTIGRPATKPKAQPTPKAKPAPAPANPSIEQLQELNRCTQSAAGDIDKITACLDRFTSGQ